MALARDQLVTTKHASRQSIVTERSDFPVRIQKSLAALLFTQSVQNFGVLERLLERACPPLPS
jgi:hypothetical protein